MATLVRELDACDQIVSPQPVSLTVDSRSNVQPPRAPLVPKRPCSGTSNIVRVFETGDPTGGMAHDIHS